MVHYQKQIFTIIQSNILLKKNQFKRWKFIGLLITLCIWQIAAIIVNHSLIIPSLTEIALTLLQKFSEARTYTALFATLLRIFVTLALDSIVAFIFGVSAGFLPKLEAVFFPTETFIRSMPTMGILLLSLIWFDSEITPIVVASLIVFPILYRGIVDGIKNIDNNLIAMSTVFKVPFLRQLRFLYIPSIKPFIITAYRTAGGLLIKVMITAEVLSQPRFGIGKELQLSRAQLDTAAIFAWAIIGIFFAYILETLLKIVFADKKLQKFTNSSIMPKDKKYAD